MPSLTIRLSTCWGSGNTARTIDEIGALFSGGLSHVAGA
jgi:hypothetical protein